MSPIVRITDPRGSTPRPLSLVAVALGSVGVGLLLLKLSLVAPRAGAVELEPLDAGEALAEQAGTDVAATRDEPEAAPPAAAAEDELGADEAAAVDAGGEAVVADVPAAPEPVVPEVPEAAEGEATASTGGPAGERTLEHGRVAYFQCPSEPCRDHGLERSVWRTLDRLGGCLGEGGQADVRVVIQTGAVSEVRFLERGAEGIPLGVLSRCVTPPLMRVTGSTLADGTVVSFRFQLAPAP